MKSIIFFLFTVAILSITSTGLLAQRNRKHKVAPVMAMNKKEVETAQHKRNIWTLPYNSTTTINCLDSITLIEFDREKLDTVMLNKQTLKISVHKGATLMQTPGARDYTSLTIFTKNYTANYTFWFDKNEAKDFNVRPLFLIINSTSSATKRLNH
jgi:hypothetical protein